jgi:type I restriction enzyme S subunit
MTAHVPKEWTSHRLKDVSAINISSLPANTDADYEFDYLEISNVNYHGIVDPNAIERLRYEDAPSRARRWLETNCTAISSVRPNLQAVAFIENAPNDLVCSTGFNVVRPAPHKLLPKFAYYSLLADGARQYFEATAKGVGYPAVDDKDFQSFSVPVPPLPEQQRIAAYLDASCVAIDAAVFAKRRQLETLDALRKSIIQAFFADQSGAITERVKDVAAKITSGVTPEGGSAGYLDSGIPLLRSQNVHFDGLRLDDVAYISVDTHAGMSGSQVKPRDVLLNITGASIGRCTFVPDGFGEGNVNQHVCVIRPGPCADYRFLAAFLSSPMGQDQILSTFTGASRQGLSHSDLGLIRIPFPKLSLQREIVGKIEHHDLKQRSLFGCIESQITTLTAYRKSLIHECVTGQQRITEVDVRAIQERAAKLTRESALPSPTV